MFIGVHLWLLLLFASGYVEAVERVALRREYNDVSAAVDSLVRVMQVADAEVLKKLPETRPDRMLPEGMTAVMIFWADDEARVWLNDFPVGETRLTPVEVTVPDLYFQGQNRLRVRCWDTDRVESGFMGGLYLKDGVGRLYPIVVSNGAWETVRRTGNGNYLCPSDARYSRRATNLGHAHVWVCRYGYHI